MTSAEYIVVYEKASGGTDMVYVDALTSQKAVDYVRQWEEDAVFIITVAKVVSKWK